MATLHTPDIHPVETFDPINNHTVEFSYTGSQIVRNRAIVLDNETCLLYTSHKRFSLPGLRQWKHIVHRRGCRPGKRKRSHAQ